MKCLKKKFTFSQMSKHQLINVLIFLLITKETVSKPIFPITHSDAGLLIMDTVVQS